MTAWEEKVINLAIALRDAKFSVEEAVTRQQFWHAVDMVKKERRDATTQGSQGQQEEGATESGE